MSEPCVRCANCGCQLSRYEVFAGRIRGLRRPICLGCAFMVVVFMKEELLPMLHEVIDILIREAAKSEA